MKHYVLDTNVISDLRVPGRNPAVERWVAASAVAGQFTTAITVAEIERGVAAKERTDQAHGAILRRWFEERVLPSFAGRILPFDLPAARMLATYRVPEHAPFDDAMIAAIAQATNMIVVTRNTRHFEPLGVACVDPTDGESSGG